MILLVLCIAIPAGAYFWIRNGSSNNATAATSSETSTSVVESSKYNKEESTETSTVESSTIAEESTVSQDTGVTSESSIAAETTRLPQVRQLIKQGIQAAMQQKQHLLHQLQPVQQRLFKQAKVQNKWLSVQGSPLINCLN